LLRDEHHNRIVDTLTPLGTIGRLGPWGRERCLYALPLNNYGPVQIVPHGWVRDEDSTQVAAPDDTIVGTHGPVWVHRFLAARWVEDTRRLAG
jgi:hypothetical protein